MARRFIAGESIEDSLKVLRDIRRQGMTLTLDPLGEAVLSEAEADSYANACVGALDELSGNWSLLESGSASADSPNLSIKLSSLYSQFDPIDNSGCKEAVKPRLRKILRTAKDRGAFVYVDMEQYAYCRLTLEIFQELLDEEEFRDFPGAGIVLQAYLRETERLARDLLKWVERRGIPISVRLVKGAYWDYEIIHAKQKGWPPPVFTSKAETDAAFERVSETLLEHFPAVRAAFGTHNIRSVAHAMATAEALGLKPADIEFQMLYGMGDPIKEAILKTDYPLRVYTPFGELIPGMAYLVRRLLENTSNESFLRQDIFMGVSPAELLADPRERMKEALEKARSELGRSYPMVIGGERVEGEKTAVSKDPSNTDRIVGRVAQASTAHADTALRAAREAFERWSRVDPEKRADILFRAADLMSRRRFDLAALEVYEVGKTWREADGDVVEAIDYLGYYGSEMIRLSADPATVRLPGETNEYIYRPRGVGAVIAPWNFPLAILTGMSSAGIVAGNAVIMKPAPQSPVVAAHLMRIYEEAGVPPGVVNFLPGAGEDIGEYLVKSPQVDFIAFTGSCEVGMSINRLAAEHPSRHGVKKVVAEMGGKNAIIIDESADIDEAVSGVIASAFGYQGQKCSAASRVIVLDSVYDEFAPRMVQAAKSLKVGPADDPSTAVGPVIDEEAFRKIHGYIDIGKKEARLLLETDISHLKEGLFVGPTIFAEVAPDSALAQEEVFGPVLAVMRSRTFDEALEIANDSAFGLTGGLYSRSPDHIAMARSRFMVGNLYINRKITAAIVRRQPFGGFKMSGIGSKAGGPDYLAQFMLPQTVGENIMRHGFAPLEGL
jgi:RHH-type proline utilization regulon transcriptional repressor/proline dehydrogenase/delta 1-pyrroline-5-carboxylate dehydrogenase